MENKNIQSPKNKAITRKDAIKKVGIYAAFTALGTMVLLSPKASQAASLSPPAPRRSGRQEGRQDERQEER